MAKSTTVALSQDELKKQAAHRAVEYAKSGMVLGLGTGSTTAYAIDRIGELMKNGELKDIIGVPTSIKSYEQASGKHVAVSASCGSDLWLIILQLCMSVVQWIVNTPMYGLRDGPGFGLV